MLKAHESVFAHQGPVLGKNRKRIAVNHLPGTRNTHPEHSIMVRSHDF